MSSPLGLSSVSLALVAADRAGEVCVYAEHMPVHVYLSRRSVDKHCCYVHYTKQKLSVICSARTREFCRRIFLITRFDYLCSHPAASADMIGQTVGAI